MTPREAGELLLRMQGCWPGFCRDDVAVTEWIADLSTLRAEWAQAAYRRCRDTLDRAPSWAKFFEAYRAEAQANPIIRPALREATVPPERAREMVAAVRSALTDAPEPPVAKPVISLEHKRERYEPKTQLPRFDEVYDQ